MEEQIVITEYQTPQSQEDDDQISQDARDLLNSSNVTDLGDLDETTIPYGDDQQSTMTLVIPSGSHDIEHYFDSFNKSMVSMEASVKVIKDDLVIMKRTFDEMMESWDRCPKNKKVKLLK